MQISRYFFLTLLIWRRGFCPNCCYIARKCMCGTQGFLRPIPWCLQRVLPLRSWPFLPAFFPTCVSCSCILLYAFSHLSSSRKKKKLWHLEEIGGKSNLRSLGPSRSHAAYRGERDSGIIWTGNFFTAKMALPWIFLSSCPLLRFNGWVESSCTACSWHSPFAETSPCDGPQLRALGVPHHMFPPRITPSCRITGTRA